MATTIQDVLRVDFALTGVLLLGNLDEIEAFKTQVNADIVVTDKGPLNLGKRIVLGRERVSLDSDITPTLQTLISREYPSTDDLGRFAQTIAYATNGSNLTDQQFQGYVCRIELIYIQDSGLPAVEYLANRVFAPGLQSDTGWVLRGGACRMTFEDGDDEWAILIEPRFGNENTDTVYLSVARRRDGVQLPSQDDIEMSLNDVWFQAHSFLDRLDEVSNSA